MHSDRTSSWFGNNMQALMQHMSLTADTNTYGGHNYILKTSELPTRVPGLKIDMC